MDAGVNMTAPAAGVAVGLVTRYDESGNLANYKLLTDILVSIIKLEKVNLRGAFSLQIIMQDRQNHHKHQAG